MKNGQGESALEKALKKGSLDDKANSWPRKNQLKNKPTASL